MCKKRIKYSYKKEKEIKVLQEAIEAFFNVLDEHFPYVKTNKISVIEHSMFHSSCQRIFNYWLENNTAKATIKKYNFAHDYPEERYIIVDQNGKDVIGEHFCYRHACLELEQYLKDYCNDN